MVTLKKFVCRDRLFQETMISQELEHQKHGEEDSADEVVAPEIGEEEGVVEEDDVVEGTKSEKNQVIFKWSKCFWKSYLLLCMDGFVHVSFDPRTGDWCAVWRSADVALGRVED